MTVLIDRTSWGRPTLTWEYKIPEVLIQDVATDPFDDYDPSMVADDNDLKLGPQHLTFPHHHREDVCVVGGCSNHAKGRWPNTRCEKHSKGNALEPEAPYTVPPDEPYWDRYAEKNKLIAAVFERLANGQ